MIQAVDLFYDSLLLEWFKKVGRWLGGEAMFHLGCGVRMRQQLFQVVLMMIRHIRRSYSRNGAAELDTFLYAQGH